MREHETRSDRLRIGAPIALGCITLLPIERIVVRVEGDGERAFFFASKALHALVVRDRDGTRAVDAGAAPLSLELLRKAVPGLDAALASTGATGGR